jgi:hypothetical protein
MEKLSPFGWKGELIVEEAGLLNLSLWTGVRKIQALNALG